MCVFWGLRAATGIRSQVGETYFSVVPANGETGVSGTRVLATGVGPWVIAAHVSVAARVNASERVHKH